MAAGRRRLANALFPVARCPLRVIEAALVLVLGAVVAYLRLGTASFAGRPWAEDGSIFLQSDVGHGFWASLPRDYAGYLHVVPRVLAGFVEPLPVAWWGPALHVAAAIVVGTVATAAYAALRGQLPGRAARAAVVLGVVAVPVGTEVVGSIANLQWFLLYGGLVVLFWQPRRTAGWATMAATALLATLSNPFAFVVLAAAGLRWAIGRGRGPLAVLTVTAVGFAVQTVRMATAAERVQSREPGLHLASQLRGFAARVLGDAIFGIGRFSVDTVAGSAWWGVAVLLALLVLGSLTWRRVDIADLHFVAALVVLAFVTYLVPVVASGAPTAQPYVIGRYYVAPAMFVLTAVVCLAARSGLLLAARTTGRSVAAAVVSTGLVAAAAFGLASSYDLASVSGRDIGPAWPAAVATERRACLDRTAASVVVLQLRPDLPRWRLRLKCRQLR